MQVDNLDKKIINELSANFPLSSEPFREIGKRLGIEEQELIKRINLYQRRGLIRRLGVVLNHYKIGLVANVMVVWKAPQDRVSEIGKIMASFAEVSHCYERVSYPELPYNLYTMIHGKNKSECEEIAKRIAEKTGINEYKLLYTIKEFKKTSIKYF